MLMKRNNIVKCNIVANCILVIWSLSHFFGLVE